MSLEHPGKNDRELRTPNPFVEVAKSHCFTGIMYLGHNHFIPACQELYQASRYAMYYWQSRFVQDNGTADHNNNPPVNE